MVLLITSFYLVALFPGGVKLEQQGERQSQNTVCMLQLVRAGVRLCSLLLIKIKFNNDLWLCRS